MKEIKEVKNLNEAVEELKRILSEDELNAIKLLKEKVLFLLHHSLGRNIRNNFGLWGDSELRKYFISIGVKHPDDMSSIIIKSLWRKLNNIPISLEEEVNFYKKYWKNMEIKNG